MLQNYDERIHHIRYINYLSELLIKYDLKNIYITDFNSLTLESDKDIIIEKNINLYDLLMIINKISNKCKCENIDSYIIRNKCTNDYAIDIEII